MNREQFKPGTIVLITTRTKYGTEQRVGEVITVKGTTSFLPPEQADYLVLYRPYYLRGYLPTGQGGFDVRKVGTKPYGKIAVEILKA